MSKEASFFIWYLLFTSCISFALFLGLTWSILLNDTVGIWQGILCINLAAGNGLVAVAIIKLLFFGETK